MLGKFSMIKKEMKAEIRSEVKKTSSINEAIQRALEISKVPLTFNDLEELMPDQFKHHEKLVRSLRRLKKQGEVQEVYVFTMDGPVKTYAPMTDTPVLICIPIKFLRECGYQVLIGGALEDKKKPYDLIDAKSDYIMIHINPVRENG
jgi:hypothetical protein